MNAAEQDLRGEVALAIMAFLTWAEFHGGSARLLDGSVAAWLTAGRPDDPGIARALVKVWGMLGRYVRTGGAVPGWFPASLLEALKKLGADTVSHALPAPSPSGNGANGAARRGHSGANLARSGTGGGESGGKGPAGSVDSYLTR